CVACSSVAPDEVMQDDLCPNCLGDEAVEQMDDDLELDEEILDDEQDEEMSDEE
ncbi:MAG: hypothetical protein UU36_C0004G0001, partial [Candidatus Uhrbacteria bacterium GW2011_GWE2_41_1153]